MKCPPWVARTMEVIPADAAPQALDIATELAQFDPQWKEPPPSWTQGMPLGNGDFGTTVYGPPENLTFLLGKNDLWIRRDRRPLRSFTWRLGRETHRRLPPARVGANGPVAWLEQDLVKGERYALAVVQVGAPLHLTAAGRSILGESEADSESDVSFYIAAAGPRDGGDPLALARRRVETAAAKGFDVLIEAHRRRWQMFWSRSWVQCADKSVEKPWYIANYLCGSLLRPGKFSPGLQGMWMRKNVPPWSNDFHGNTNIQATYHGVFGSNHMELFEPCATLYTEMLPECRREPLTWNAEAKVVYRLEPECVP